MRKSTKAITTAFSRLDFIENDQDLKNENLTLSDYREAFMIFNDLNSPGKKTFTNCKNVAEFYKRSGFTVNEKNGVFNIYTTI